MTYTHFGTYSNMCTFGNSRPTKWHISWMLAVEMFFSKAKKRKTDILKRKLQSVHMLHSLWTETEESKRSCFMCPSSVFMIVFVFHMQSRTALHFPNFNLSFTRTNPTSKPCQLWIDFSSKSPLHSYQKQYICGKTSVHVKNSFAQQTVCE